MANAISQYKWILLLEGILFVILGITAISVPWVFSFSAVLIIASLFVVGGIITLIRAFQAKGLLDVSVSLASSLLYFIVGGLMFTHPQIGLISLTVLLAIFFFIQGILQIYTSFQLKPLEGWGFLLISGIASIILAAIIWSGLPGSAVWVIGLLVGINLIFSGASMLSIGWNLKTPKDKEGS